jgi:hypothetical protein
MYLPFFLPLSCNVKILWLGELSMANQYLSSKVLEVDSHPDADAITWQAALFSARLVNLDLPAGQQTLIRTGYLTVDQVRVDEVG